jgi:hypothetical protein
MMTVPEVDLGGLELGRCSTMTTTASNERA